MYISLKYNLKNVITSIYILTSLQIKTLDVNADHLRPCQNHYTQLSSFCFHINIDIQVRGASWKQVSLKSYIFWRWNIYLCNGTLSYAKSNIKCRARIFCSYLYEDSLLNFSAALKKIFSPFKVILVIINLPKTISVKLSWKKVVTKMTSSQVGMLPSFSVRGTAYSPLSGRHGHHGLAFICHYEIVWY